MKQITFLTLLFLASCSKPCENTLATCTHSTPYAYQTAFFEDGKWHFTNVKTETKTDYVGTCDTSQWLQEKRMFDKFYSVRPGEQIWEIFKASYPNTCNCY